MDLPIKQLEEQLDSFDLSQRKESLCQLWSKVIAGEVELPPIAIGSIFIAIRFFHITLMAIRLVNLPGLRKKQGWLLQELWILMCLTGLRNFIGLVGRLI